MRAKRAIIASQKARRFARFAPDSSLRKERFAQDDNPRVRRPTRKPRQALLDRTGGSPYMSFSQYEGVWSGGFVFASAEILDQIFGRSQGKRQDADGGGFVGAV